MKKGSVSSALCLKKINAVAVIDSIKLTSFSFLTIHSSISSYYI